MKMHFKLALSTLTLALATNTFAKDELVVFSLPNLSSPFEVQLQKVAIETSQKLDIKLQVLDGQSSSTKQASDLENAITRGAKGVVISPNDVNAISAAVEEIISENIPAATLDRKVQSSKPVPHFGANNYTGGQEIAKAIKTKYPNGAKIILLTGQPGSTSNIERTKGIRDELTVGGEKYQIIVDQTGNWLRSEGLRIIESVLPTLKTKPDVIIAANDDMALGAVEALKSQGYKAGDILVTGFDAVPEALARIKDGWLFLTADQRPGYAVSSALEQVVGNIRDKKEVSGADYAPKVISKENLQEAERFSEVSE
ncbi:sugar ABC transporter substrate-binding protein [Vespertiliibacter pulmonis]|uniref:Monosaccharide ABC transporter substrate-binding protein (CUT2 family) n=1 Tax=Vespertiliibacter pulmonis TaxID=1443036 RepID=A0A3N4WDV8_9PAST|nr:sugar ABC transporter substrate-binding protein [Vespertiliibacter pulmonis]QLB20795.1 sugar ABC transporter substrate-binding protein [Vespertiliibacter pulmonis]RPE83444.1 monosaccharide ABC transporter substrate-binding protein (CUT2 family) [Vespertiliibacter pulmonis]